jgi:hypothetical protein
VEANADLLQLFVGKHLWSLRLCQRITRINLSKGQEQNLQELVQLKGFIGKHAA